MCKSKRCKTRPTMTLDKEVMVNGKLIKLDFRFDCSAESLIDLALCKICWDFYFGQTINSMMDRNNGHRDKFKLGKEDLSALSHHIYEKHPEFFDQKLEKFIFGIVKQVSPGQLD